MEVVIKKGGRQLLKKLIRKGSNYQERNEVIRFENQEVISKIAFGIVHGQSYKGFQKLPHMQLQLLVIRIKCEQIESAILLELYVLGGTIKIETMGLEYGKFKYPILWFSTLKKKLVVLILQYCNYNRWTYLS